MFLAYYSFFVYFDSNGENKTYTKEGQRGEKGALDQGRKGKVGKEGKEAPLSSAPPLPSQKALTCKGGGEDGGRG